MDSIEAITGRKNIRAFRPDPVPREKIGEILKWSIHAPSAINLQPWEFVIHSVINRNRARHSRESGNPAKHWIPGQARNDKLHKIYVVMYSYHIAQKLDVPVPEFKVVRIGESFKRNYFGHQKDEEIEVRAGLATPCKTCQDPSPCSYSSGEFLL